MRAVRVPACEAFGSPQLLTLRSSRPMPGFADRDAVAAAVKAGDADTVTALLHGKDRLNLWSALRVWCVWGASHVMAASQWAMT